MRSIAGLANNIFARNAWVTVTVTNAPTVNGSAGPKTKSIALSAHADKPTEAATAFVHATSVSVPCSTGFDMASGEPRAYMPPTGDRAGDKADDERLQESGLIVPACRGRLHRRPHIVVAKPPTPALLALDGMRAMGKSCVARATLAVRAV